MCNEKCLTQKIKGQKLRMTLCTVGYMMARKAATHITKVFTSSQLRGDNDLQSFLPETDVFIGGNEKRNIREKYMGTKSISLKSQGPKLS